MDARSILQLDAMYCPRRGRMCRWSVEEAEPLLVYRKRGKALPFFSELLLSPVQSSRGRFYLGLYAGFNHARGEDWREWAELPFAEGYALDAFAQVAARRDLPPVGIWLTLPYPPAGDYVYESGWKSRDFSTGMQRLLALHRWIDTVLDRWRERVDPNRVRLRGFVWGRAGMPEFDKDVVRLCNEWIGAHGLDRMWLPNFQSASVLDWRSLGFSRIAIFPNYTGRSHYGPEWLEQASTFASLNDMGIQLVYGKGALYDSRHFGRYADMKHSYLRSGGIGPLLYRFPNHSLLELFHSNKRAYDRVYRSFAEPGERG